MIGKLISELVAYGLQNHLVSPADQVYVTNRLLELFEVLEYEEKEEPVVPRALSLILEDMLAYALEREILEEDTITARDLFDTKIMGILTPSPSVVRKTFADKYNSSPNEATDFYYAFSQATNYIRRDRIEKMRNG